MYTTALDPWYNVALKLLSWPFSAETTSEDASKVKNLKQFQVYSR